MSSIVSSDENFERLRELLREMFQLNRGDLDFGLYRVMNMKSAEVEKFLNDDLLPQVETALGKTQLEDIEYYEKQYAEKIKKAKGLGIEKPEDVPGVKDAKANLEDARNRTAEPAKIYNHLYQFFSRYYEGGDFMSLRRHRAEGKEAYFIPYNGEEVKLHWANADQYYIKTTANYQSYLFVLNDKRRVRFQIAAADNEKDNNKAANGKERRFVLVKKNPVHIDDGVLVVAFEHRPLTAQEKQTYGANGSSQQKMLNDEAHGAILRAIEAIDKSWLMALEDSSPTKANGERTVLQKHLDTYVAKNEFDYFIHKDLSGFLTRELEFYLKNEVLVLDDIENNQTALSGIAAEMKATRLIGGKIIAFLAQLEEFQKRLWLKKKFVLQTDYCVTLDRVPQDFHKEIADNKAQVQEWQKLFAIDVSSVSEKSLRDNPFLVLDTVHFDSDFKDKLLATLSDNAIAEGKALEDTMDGLLIHGENFQALNLLQARYREQVQCIYIDPPYNTSASEIVYKNGYKHSSWITLVENRINFGRLLLSEDGINTVTIDYAEFYNLGRILDNEFGSESRLGIVTILINPKGRQHEQFFSSSTEYMICHANNPAKAIFNKTTLDLEKEVQFTEVDKDGRYRLDNFARIRSSTTRALKPDFYYPLYVSPDGSKITLEEIPNYQKVIPIGDDGIEYSWKVKADTFQERNEEKEYVAVRDEESGLFVIKNKFREQQVFKNIWTDKKYFPEFQGTNLVKNLFGNTPFDYPKSIFAVQDLLKIAAGKSAFILDYFAGSGTTGHAVINLNREDGGNRKYILVEVGNYFDTVLLPRLKKVAYSPDWKDGKPISRQGSTQFFKYLRIESYEDSLDALVREKLEGDLLTGVENEALQESYKLHYALTHETRASSTLLGKRFDKPHAYTLSVVRDGTRRDETADLAETFNYLLGLKLIGRWHIDSVLVIKGTDLQGKTYLILWRDMTEMDNAKLDEWFVTHRARFGDDIDTIYVNGDQTLNTQKTANDTWQAQSIEPTFRERMFEETR